MSAPTMRPLDSVTRDRIAAALEQCDGACMDDAADRARVLEAVCRALTVACEPHGDPVTR